jgi:hypothetical protein
MIPALVFKVKRKIVVSQKSVVFFFGFVVVFDQAVAGPASLKFRGGHLQHLESGVTEIM